MLIFFIDNAILACSTYMAMYISSVNQTQCVVLIYFDC